jgi:hypothetical protein
VRNSLHWLLGMSLVLVSGSADAKEDQWRWRVFNNTDEVIFAFSDVNEATDNLSLPLFRCHKGRGRVQMEGEAPEPLRLAMAEFIRNNREPKVKSSLDDGADPINIVFSADDRWEFRVTMAASGSTFEQFKRAGVLQFQVGKAVVRQELKIKTGLEGAAQFQEICKRPP